MTFTDWMTEQGLLPTTREKYKAQMTRFFDMMVGKPLVLKTIQEWKEARMSSVGNAEINQGIAAIKAYCEFQVQSGKMEQSTLDRIRDRLSTLKTNGKSAPSRPPKESVRKLLAIMDTLQVSTLVVRDRLIVHLMLYGGMRVGEIGPLDWGDVQKNGHDSIRIRGKGGKERTIPIHSELKTAIDAYRDWRTDNGPRFSDRLPLIHIQRTDPLQRISTASIRDILKRYSAASEVAPQINCHSLRHSFAYNYLDKNPGDIVGLQILMGHSNISSTVVYVQHSEETLRTNMEKIEI